MAHKGQRWKLWFRRDLSTQVDNYHRQAMPEAFVYLQFGILSSVYHVDRLHDSLCYNTRKDDSTIRLWSGDPTSGPGNNVRMEFEITDSDLEFQRRFEIRIYAAGGAPLLGISFLNVAGVNRVTDWRGNLPSPILFQDPDIVLNAGGIAVALQPARYARYNF